MPAEPSFLLADTPADLSASTNWSAKPPDSAVAGDAPTVTWCPLNDDILWINNWICWSLKAREPAGLAGGVDASRGGVCASRGGACTSRGDACGSRGDTCTSRGDACVSRARALGGGACSSRATRDAFSCSSCVCASAARPFASAAAALVFSSSLSRLLSFCRSSLRAPLKWRSFTPVVCTSTNPETKPPRTHAIKAKLATFANAVADANDNPSKGHIALLDWLFDCVTLILAVRHALVPGFRSS